MKNICPNGIIFKDFEDTSKDLGLPLFVLPPAKPTYNDQIERSNRAVREEFYTELSEDTIVEAHRELMNFLQKCNIYCLHSAL